MWHSVSGDWPCCWITQASCGRRCLVLWWGWKEVVSAAALRKLMWGRYPTRLNALYSRRQTQYQIDSKFRLCTTFPILALTLLKLIPKEFILSRAMPDTRCWSSGDGSVKLHASEIWKQFVKSSASVSRDLPLSGFNALFSGSTLVVYNGGWLYAPSNRFDIRSNRFKLSSLGFLSLSTKNQRVRSVFDTQSKVSGTTVNLLMG